MTKIKAVLGLLLICLLTPKASAYHKTKEALVAKTIGVSTHSINPRIRWQDSGATFDRLKSEVLEIKILEPLTSFNPTHSKAYWDPHKVDLGLQTNSVKTMTLVDLLILKPIQTLGLEGKPRSKLNPTLE